MIKIWVKYYLMHNEKLTINIDWDVVNVIQIGRNFNRRCTEHTTSDNNYSSLFEHHQNSHHSTSKNNLKILHKYMWTLTIIDLNFPLLHQVFPKKVKTKNVQSSPKTQRGLQEEVSTIEFWILKIKLTEIILIKTSRRSPIVMTILIIYQFM